MPGLTSWDVGVLERISQRTTNRATLGAHLVTLGGEKEQVGRRVSVRRAGGKTGAPTGLCRVDLLDPGPADQNRPLEAPEPHSHRAPRGKGAGTSRGGTVPPGPPALRRCRAGPDAVPLTHASLGALDGDGAPAAHPPSRIERLRLLSEEQLGPETGARSERLPARPAQKIVEISQLDTGQQRFQPVTSGHASPRMAPGAGHRAGQGSHI